MKIIVTKYLNVRVGAPSVNAPCYNYLAPGSVIDVEDDPVPGDYYDNNNKWYKGLDGSYYWSGGLCDTSRKFVDAAILQIKALQNPNVIGIGSLAKMENGAMVNCIQMTVKDDTTKNYFLNSFNINGITPAFDIHVINQPVTHSVNFPGAGIRNLTGANGSGTFGCVVIDNLSEKRALLSCQHVLKDNFDYNVMNANTQILLSSDASSFATHTRGLRDSETDAGIATLNDQTITNALLAAITGTRDITDYDVAMNTRVTLQGYDVGTNMVVKQNGIIINDKFSSMIDYKDGSPAFQINNLIMLSHNGSGNFNSISKPGYSGSVVIDDKNYIIGMVVGGDDKFTYAMPINPIKSKLNFEILI